ncbi:MAG: Hpt domain-containing protein [Pseudomonadota bacterium]
MTEQMKSEFDQFNEVFLLEFTGGDQVLRHEILSEFRNNFFQYVRELDANRSDTHQVRQMLHRLKGAARSVGGTAIGEACSAVEAEFFDDTGSAVEGHQTRQAEALDRFLRDCHSFLKNTN